MNKKKKKKINKFVNSLQKTLRLQDWSIEVVFKEPKVESAYATMDTFGESRHAELRVSKNFFNLPKKLQKQTLVHELMHCHLFFIEGSVLNILKDVLPNSKAVMVHSVLTTEIERTTDALADVVSSLVAMKY